MFGALGRVLRQIARPVLALLLVVGELLDVELLALLHGAGAQLVGNLHADVADGRAKRVLKQLHGEALCGRPDLVGAVLRHPLVQADQGVQVPEAAVLYSATLT